MILKEQIMGLGATTKNLEQSETYNPRRKRSESSLLRETLLKEAMRHNFFQIDQQHKIDHNKLKTSLSYFEAIINQFSAWQLKEQQVDLVDIVSFLLEENPGEKKYIKQMLEKASIKLMAFQKPENKLEMLLGEVSFLLSDLDKTKLYCETYIQMSETKTERQVKFIMNNKCIRNKQTQLASFLQNIHFQKNLHVLADEHEEQRALIEQYFPEYFSGCQPTLA